ncbi:MAG: hypothetical protein H0X58_06620 [Acidimicrobiia bacterium]|nr:hypothetical protein [Acidimicrobiia bacterium]
MPEEAQARDPEGRHREGQGGGRSSRGPNADPGGEIEPGGLVPPYEGRGAEGKSADDRAASVERQLAETKTGQPGQTAAPADERPPRPGDPVATEAPESPLGVGVSTTTRGEDVGSGNKEAGRHDTGTRGESERPTGTSDERDSTGVNPQGSGDAAPTMPTGD